MTQHVCSCHCGSNLFYKHLHAESCALSWREHVAVLKACEQTALDRVADLTAKLEEAQEDARRVRIERDNTYENLLDIKAKLAAVERERDALRTALLALPVAQGTIRVEGSEVVGVEPIRGATDPPMWWRRKLGGFNDKQAAESYAALLRLAQKMRGK